MHAPLFTAPVLLIEQPRHLYSSEGHYEVLSESGHSLAYVNEHMTAWSHRGGSHRPHRFSVYGTDGARCSPSTNPGTAAGPTSM